MSLSIVVPFLNNYALAQAAIASLERNLALSDTEIVALNNGSTDGDFDLPSGSSARVVTLAENIGNYPVFALSPSLASPGCDLIAIFHSDLFVHEPGFDHRITGAFTRHGELGLLGFVGSNEIDAAGGRGAGTVSNFQGATLRGGIQLWQGSPAEAHGRRSAGLERAAVVDGCAMVFRRSVLSAVPHWPNFPPHHFYDRLLSCQVMELGYLVAVLGIACDHISGQTANSSDGYRDLARNWCRLHLGLEHSSDWDHEIYRQAEARWLHEYRERKHFIPLQVPAQLPEAYGRKLNLGCDSYYLPGFLNIDLRKDANVTPDIASDVYHLPFRDETFDFIYAGHLLEHLYYDRVPEYLNEWRRVLRPNGRLTVVVPDIGTSMRRYAAGIYTLDHLLPQMFGQWYSWDYGPHRHCYAYDYPRLVESLTRVPWQTVAQLDFSRPPAEILPLVGVKISAADWQMGVVLTK
jgi:hypothetical protein